jgi:hypothetical protein
VSLQVPGGSRLIRQRPPVGAARIGFDDADVYREVALPREG